MRFRIHQFLYQTNGRITSYCTSEIPAIDVCAFILFYDEKKNWSKFNIYIHISFRETSTSLFPIRDLFSSFLRFVLRFFHFFSSFFLSFSVFPQHIVLHHSKKARRRHTKTYVWGTKRYVEDTIKLKYSNVALCVVLKKGFSVIWPYQIKTVHRVLAVWAKTPSVLTYVRKTRQTCFSL